MTIIRDQNPERYATVIGSHLYMLQVEEDQTVKLIKTRNKIQATRKPIPCQVLYDGTIPGQATPEQFFTFLMKEITR